MKAHKGFDTKPFVLLRDECLLAVVFNQKDLDVNSSPTTRSSAWEGHLTPGASFQIPGDTTEGTLPVLASQDGYEDEIRQWVESSQHRAQPSQGSAQGATITVELGITIRLHGSPLQRVSHKTVLAVLLEEPRTQAAVGLGELVFLQLGPGFTRLSALRLAIEAGIQLTGLLLCGLPALPRPNPYRLWNRAR